MAKKGEYGFMEAVSDEELINLIENGVQNSVGDWLNSSDMAQERLKATYEYAGVPSNHLAPQGVSTIVDTSTTEVIEAYTAILSELLISNGKLARFVPYDGSPTAFQAAKAASDITNYCIFKKNNGWEIIERWIKAALLWKNAVIRWDYIEDYDYMFEEYDTIPQVQLDERLSEEGIEIIGDLEQDYINGQIVYKDVRLRKTIDKSTVEINLVPPENFRITRDATNMDDASFVGIQVEMTRSEIRKRWPDIAEEIEDWNELGNDTSWRAKYSEEQAARKYVTGQEYWEGGTQHDLLSVEANRDVTVTECWLRVDRDGDGIAELKRFLIAGNNILHEEDVSTINLAMLCPFDIPFEFFGLSMADMTRSSTLAGTAVIRGFIENVYLTNYSPKLADPNVVDFSALQNMKPKQIIPTNGNPQAAVAPLAPETISPGTVPVLEYLQLHKEQGTGMSKAAQGIQDELFVSGNSEIKLQQVMSAAQTRIQHVARRFAETGIKRMLCGVYMEMRKNMQKVDYSTPEGLYSTIDPKMLPAKMEIDIHLDIGENSNQSKVQKLQVIGQQIIPALREAGADMVVKPEAAAILATKAIDMLGMNPGDFLEDYTTPEFQEQAKKAMEQQAAEASEMKAIEKRKIEADAMAAEANVNYITAQANNALQDNIRQTAVAIDKHYQEWEKLVQDARDEGVEPPAKPDIQAIMDDAVEIVEAIQQRSGVEAPQGTVEEAAQQVENLQQP